MLIMKYATNHPWKFQKYKTAFLAGILQSTSAMVITLVNYAVILQADNALDLAKDFTALMVIAQFDNFYYNASKLTLLKDVLENHANDYASLFEIETTTSLDARGNQNVKLKEDKILDQIRKNARNRDKENKKSISEAITKGNFLGRLLYYFYKEKKIQERPLFIRLGMGKRSYSNFAQYLYYRFIRIIYVSFWFYYLPVFVMIFANITPVIQYLRYEAGGSLSEKGHCV